jgi:tRNA (Thr-GGU) A37 N-methylase
MRRQIDKKMREQGKARGVFYSRHTCRPNTYPSS